MCTCLCVCVVTAVTHTNTHTFAGIDTHMCAHKHVSVTRTYRTGTQETQGCAASRANRKWYAGPLEIARADSRVFKTRRAPISLHSLCWGGEGRGLGEFNLPF